MKKDIVCVKFKEDVSIEEAEGFYKSIHNKIKEDYHVIGVFDRFVEVDSISKDTKILHIDGKQYSTEELLEVIDKATRYDDLCR